MSELFPIELKAPEGFSYINDFLTIDEETRLLDYLRTVHLHPFLFQGYEAKRRVASFGFDYSFDSRKLSKGVEIPDELKWLVSKVATYLSISVDAFVELLVTEYPVGAVINWHRDAPPFDVIVGISLAGDCTFKLRPHDKSKQSRGSTISLKVTRRSLYVIAGPAREEWQHSTSPVDKVRYSITLRTLRK